MPNWADWWDFAVRRIEEAIPGLVVTSIGGGCPVQADGYVRSGIYGGLGWYFRYRHDEAYLYVFMPDPEGRTEEEGWAYLNLEATQYYCEILDALRIEDNGVLTPEQTEQLLVRLWERLRPITEWESTGRQRLQEAVEQMTQALEDGSLVTVEERLPSGVTVVGLQPAEDRKDER